MGPMFSYLDGIHQHCFPVESTAVPSISIISLSSSMSLSLVGKQSHDDALTVYNTAWMKEVVVVVVCSVVLMNVQSLHQKTQH